MEASPASPVSPTSPTSPMIAFLDEAEGVLEWVSDWEQRNSTMDQKHVEVLCSKWQLMRDCAREHTQVIQQMKQAMRELRANGMTLQDRLDALERRMRQEIRQEQDERLSDLEARLSERVRREQEERLDALERAIRGDLRALRDDLARDQGDRTEALQRQLGDKAAEGRRADEQLLARIDQLDSMVREELGLSSREEQGPEEQGSDLEGSPQRRSSADAGGDGAGGDGAGGDGAGGDGAGGDGAGSLEDSRQRRVSFRSARSLSGVSQASSLEGIRQRRSSRLEEHRDRMDTLEQQFREQSLQQASGLEELEKALREDLGKEISTRLDNLRQSVREEMGREQRERLGELDERVRREQASSIDAAERRLTDDLERVVGDRLEALRRGLNDGLGRDLEDRMEVLEKRLREKINQEQASREADVQELQDLFRAAQQDSTGKLESLQVGLDALQRTVSKEAEVLREVKRYLTDETAARERCHASLHERVEFLARLLVDCTEKQASLHTLFKQELKAEVDRREQDVEALSGRVAGLQERIEQEVRRKLALWEANLDRFQDLFGEERAARLRDLTATREALERERTAREVHVRTLQDLFEKEAELREASVSELQDSISCEKEAREKHCEAVRAALEVLVNHQELSVQERLDQVFGLLHGSSNGMLKYWQESNNWAEPLEPARAPEPVEPAVPSASPDPAVLPELPVVAGTAL